MCTEVTNTVVVKGSAVVDGEWAGVDRAVVYYDHPQSVSADHALCIDLWSGTSRVAVELDAASARSLAAAILTTLDDDAVAALVGR
ncbi:MAG: DUF6295 family protein [Acidimicrobiia bacterium]